MSYARAVKAINKHHILLVYPIKNAPEPQSLWSILHQGVEMHWDWSEHADRRIEKMWHLKDELCEHRDVVYAKWFRGRATFFSKEIFPAFLRVLGTTQFDEVLQSRDGDAIYQQLLDNSPQTPSMLKEAVEMESEHNRARFDKAMNVLWKRLFIVGTGEVDEGQFPALAAGATRHMFEDLWDEAEEMTLADAQDLIAKNLSPDSLFLKFLQRRLKTPLNSKKTPVAGTEFALPRGSDENSMRQSKSKS